MATACMGAVRQSGWTPVLVVHCGPGSGLGPGNRRTFDPSATAPSSSTSAVRPGLTRVLPSADRSVNTTDHLLVDMERLRTHLGIDGGCSHGWSWG